MYPKVFKLKTNLDMYQIASNSATIKLNDAEKAIFNATAENLQTIGNTVFTNSKQIVFALISRISELETSKIELENQINDLETELETLKTTPPPDESNEFQKVENSEIKQELIAAIGYEETPSDDELYSDLLEIITTSLEPAEPEKEIVEIERKLTDNEFLLTLKAAQTEVLNTIARWRFMTQKDDHTNNIPELILRMLFNKGVLLNWHGQFDTGISEKHFNSAQ